jgi:glycosyltransferase involved in cell wall biosynthesis
VSDNCSTDHTRELTKSFKSQKIKFFSHKENIGANNNFNFCLEQARGQYFLLLHDDDLIDHDFIEVCMNAVQSSGETGIIRTGTRIIDSHGKVLREAVNLSSGVLTSEFFLAWFSSRTSLYLCSTLFHTEKLRSVGGLNSKYNLLQDVKASVQLAAMFGRVEIPDIKASFRRHEQELTFNTRVIDWCNESQSLLKLMCSLVTENKALVNQEGMRFFANLNYRRVREVKSPLKRAIYYLMVFQKFRYRYSPPPVNRFLSLPRRFYHILARHRRSG